MEATRTYLELTSPGQFRDGVLDQPHARVERMAACPASFYRYLYTEVGRQYYWVDRLPWTDAMIGAHLSTPGISVHALYVGGAPAGYFELRRWEDGSVEVAYFGLLPEFVGRGLGKHLLTVAVQQAWEMAPTRVWLHTSSLDHPAALPNYLARGFVILRSEPFIVGG